MPLTEYNGRLNASSRCVFNLNRIGRVVHKKLKMLDVHICNHWSFLPYPHNKIPTPNTLCIIRLTTANIFNHGPLWPKLDSNTHHLKICFSFILGRFVRINAEGKLTTQLYDKRDDFSFTIVNFPYICSFTCIWGIHLSTDSIC